MINIKRVEQVMEEAFGRMYSDSMVVELTKENITDYERGRISGRIEALKFLAFEFNRVGDDEAEIIRD